MLPPLGLSFQNIHKEFQQNLDYIFYSEVGEFYMDGPTQT